MPHIAKNMGIHLGKPDIYDNQNKKAWEQQQKPKQKSKGKKKLLNHTRSTMSEHLDNSVKTEQARHIMEKKKREKNVWESRPEHPETLPCSRFIDLIDFFPLST